MSLLPPLLAITLALVTRQVYLALGGGIWLGCILLAGGNPLTGLGDAIESVVGVLGSPGDARVIMFTLVIGALIATIEASGGVRGFIAWMENRQWANDGKRAQWLAFVTGVIIFIESNITVLVAGSISRPLFDRYRVAREKLAYIIDSTSAPICILIPLNAWGAFNLSLLDKVGVEDPLAVFLASIPLNLYALLAVLLTAVVIATGWNIGPMAAAQRRTEGGQPTRNAAVARPEPAAPTGQAAGTDRAIDMVLPLAVMVLAMPLGLWVTGDGDLVSGSGSTSVLWAVLAALASSWALLLGRRAMTVDELTGLFLRGAGDLLPMAIILLLALSLGGVTRELGTGVYVAALVPPDMHPGLMLPAVFACSAFIAFSVGSSWGTFAIMVPIAIPAGAAFGLPAAPFLAAVLSGGVFGDHASPISDTTVIASMASRTDHIDHVRTQLPYALLAGVMALLGFAIIGISL
jgi:Na+/H+ antiporter NhaC